MAISTNYWPIAWPAPEPTVLTVFTGASVLTLPVRPPRNEDKSLRAFPPPEQAPGDTPTQLRPLKFVRELGRDLTTNETIYRLHSDAGELGGAALARIDSIDLEIGKRFEKHYRISETDPLSARVDTNYTTSFRREGWNIRVDVRTRLAASHDAFHFSASLEAFEDDARIFAQHWDTPIARDLV